jgi:predicted transcriptional regulator
MNTLIITQPTVSTYVNTNRNKLIEETRTSSSEIPKLALCAIIVLDINGRKEHIGAFFLKSDTFISDEAFYTNLGGFESETDDYFKSMVETVKSERKLPNRITESILNDFARNPNLFEMIDNEDDVELTIVLPNFTASYKSSQVDQILKEALATIPVFN